MSFHRAAKGGRIAEPSYRDFFHGLADMVLITTPLGVLLEINPGGIEALGYDGESEIGEIPVDRHYVDASDRLRLVGLLREKGSVKDFETRLIRKDGKEIDVWITAHAAKDGTGQVIFCRELIKDVTHFKRHQEQLREKTRLLERHVRALTQEREQIEEQAHVLAKTVAELDEAKRVVEEQHRMITVELDMAAKLQRSLLPRRFPKVEGLSFASKYLPSNRIGGDFFDVIKLGHGDIGVVIADVSGHGPAAALLTTMFKISFQTYALEVRSPSGVLARLNRDFCRLITTGEYITAFYAVLNTQERRMSYAKAGHPYPILFRNNTRTHELLDAEGFFIGMFEEALFEDVEASLGPGDRLFLYTDGVTEARNGTGVCFEINHLVSILAQQQDLSCEAVVEEILKQLTAFTRRDRFDDDLCMVLLSVDA